MNYHNESHKNHRNNILYVGEYNDFGLQAKSSFYLGSTGFIYINRHKANKLQFMFLLCIWKKVQVQETEVRKAWTQNVFRNSSFTNQLRYFYNPIVHTSTCF